MYFSGENVYALFPSGKDMIHGAHFIIENALHKRDARSLLKTQRAANFNPLFPYGKRLYVGTTTVFRRLISIHSSHTGRDSV